MNVCLFWQRDRNYTCLHWAMLASSIWADLGEITWGFLRNETPNTGIIAREELLKISKMRPRIASELSIRALNKASLKSALGASKPCQNLKKPCEIIKLHRSRKFWEPTCMCGCCFWGWMAVVNDPYLLFQITKMRLGTFRIGPLVRTVPRIILNLPKLFGRPQSP